MPMKYIPIPYRPNYRPVPHLIRGLKKTDEQTGIPTTAGKQIVDAYGVPSEYLLGSPDRWKDDAGTSTCNAGQDNGLDAFPRTGYGTRYVIDSNGNQHTYGD